MSMVAADANVVPLAALISAPFLIKDLRVLALIEGSVASAILVNQSPWLYFFRHFDSMFMVSL